MAAAPGPSPGCAAVPRAASKPPGPPPAPQPQPPDRPPGPTECPRGPPVSGCGGAVVALGSSHSQGLVELGMWENSVVAQQRVRDERGRDSRHAVTVVWALAHT